MKPVEADLNGMNLATVWEAVAATVPSAAALIHKDLTRTWAEFDDRAARIAAHLESVGLSHESNVALYLYNGPEYLESTFGSFKLRAATLNVNYRYLEDELQYLFDNSQAQAVVFAAEFAARLEAVRGSLPLLQSFLCVGATAEYPVPDWAVDYEQVINQTEPMAPISRSGDDLWLLYTGGTTGNPKGVMWPHRSLLGTAKT
ncbi:MAG: AMP-binding protein, partial [Microthrixaceae bacterium]